MPKRNLWGGLFLVYQKNSEPGRRTTVIRITGLAIIPDNLITDIPQPDDLIV